MASPVPKPAAQRQRRNRTTTTSEITAPPAQRLALPDDYHELTKAWWSTIWNSPIAEEWVDADTPGLVALAQLVEDFWCSDRDHRAKAHAEVRMASREFGLSPFSRRQLQWEIKKVEAAGGKPDAEPVRRGKPRFSVLAGRSA